MRHRAFIVGVLVSLVALGGVAAPSGKLVIWSATSATLTRALVDAFSAKYPNIEVEVITAGSGELLARLRAEWPNPSGDILLGIAQEAFEGYYDYFLGYKVAEDDKIPFKDSRTPPKYYGMSMPIQAFIVNTELLKPWEYPRCWKDLALPVYKGKIIMANPATSGSAYSQIFQMYELYGFEFLKLLAPNVTFVASSKIVPEAVARGEYAIGVTGDYNVARKMAEGAPVIVIYPCEGTGARFDATGIIKNGPNPDNAKLFMDWVTTKEAYEIVVKVRFRRTVRPDVVAPEGLPPLNDIPLIPYDAVKAAEIRDELTTKFVDLIG